MPDFAKLIQASGMLKQAVDSGKVKPYNPPKTQTATGILERAGAIADADPLVTAIAKTQAQELSPYDTPMDTKGAAGIGKGIIFGAGGDLLSAAGTLARGLAEMTPDSPGGWDEGPVNTQPIIDTGKAVQQTGRRLAEAGAQGVAEAKEGKSALGQFGVDLAVAGGQMVADQAANLILPGSSLAVMGARSAGAAAREAEDKGADIATQMTRGATHGGISVLTESLSNIGPIKKIYGEGFLQKFAPALVERITASPIGTILTSALSEGGEEVLESALDALADRLIYDPKAKFDPVEAGYSALVGAALGAIGGGAEVMASRQGANADQFIQAVANTAREGTPQAAQARQGGEGVSVPTQAQGPAVDTPVGVLGQAVAQFQNLGVVTNATAEAVLADQAAQIILANETGLNTAGMTRSQQRAAAKAAVAQYAEAQTGTTTPSQGQITPDGVENPGAFDSAEGMRYNSSVINWDDPSQQFRDVTRRLDAGENVALDELMAVPEIAMAEAEGAKGIPTIQRGDRSAIHQRAIETARQWGSFTGKDARGEHFDGDVRQEHRMDIVIGLPGSGKSSIYTNPISQRYGSRVIDTDSYRPLIPEYNGLNSGMVHKEASHIRDVLLDEAIARGDNIILSSIGDDAAKLRAQIEFYKSQGYSVFLHLNEVPNHKSLARAITRYVGDNESHRYVPVKLIMSFGDLPTQTYLELTGQKGADYGSRQEQTGRSGAVLVRADGRSGGGKPGLSAAEGSGAQSLLTGWDWFNNDVPRGERAVRRDAFSVDTGDWYGQKTTQAGGKTYGGSTSVGAADLGFTTGDRAQHKTSQVHESTQQYNTTKAEAAGIYGSGEERRAAWRQLFDYIVQTEEQSRQRASEIVYREIEGRRVFIRDFDPDGYTELLDELRNATAWNAVQTDVSQIILDHLLQRSLEGTASQEEYRDWLQVDKDHSVATAQGTQARAKWSRSDNDGGHRSAQEAWENLERSNLTQEERDERFRDVCRWNQEIESAETTDDLKRIILEIAQERGTVNGLTGRQSRVLYGLADVALDGLSMDQLRQFAYQSSTALTTDATAANIGQKIKTIQVLNMLSNPKTAAKNLAGNTTFYGLDAMAMRGGALLDMALSRITGTRSVAMEGFLATDPQARRAMLNALRLSMAEVTLDVDMGGEGRYGTGSTRTNKASGNFLERVLSSIERNQGYLLTTSDEAYKGMARGTQARTQRLVDSGRIRTSDPHFSQRQAENLALYRTFQNQGKVAAGIQTIHDILNMVGVGDSGKRIKGQTVHSFGVGDLVAPFTRVAGNLAAVGVDYSPVGAVKGTVEIIDTIRRAAMGQTVDPARQAKAVSDTARGLTGSAIAYAVAALAGAGLIKRADDEDDADIAALNRSEGMTGTQINLDAAKRWANGGSTRWESGDTLVDLSNLEPLNFIVSLGVELADNDADSIISTFGDVETYKDTMLSAAETAGDLPILQSVGDFAKDTMVYHKDPLSSAIEMVGKTAISSVTPNIVASVAKGMDEKQRYTYSGDGTADVLRDTLISRIPRLRETLPTVTDTVGQEKANAGDLTTRLVNALVNPIGVNEYTQSDVSREMERVREETGVTNFYPTTRKPSELTYTDKEGKKHEVALDFEAKQEFQAKCSAVQLGATEAMMGSNLYKSAGPSTQADLLKRCYDYAYQEAKGSVLGVNAMEGWARNADTARADIGLSPTEFLYYYEKYGAGLLSGDAYEKTKRMVAAGLTLDEWAAFKAKADADGNGSVKKAEVTDYIEATFPQDQWRAIFDAYKGGSNWKDPY